MATLLGTKLEAMNHYLESLGEKVKGQDVRRAVLESFQLDLDMISKNKYGIKLSIYPEPIMKSVRQSLNMDNDSVDLDAKIMDMPKAEVMDRYIAVHNYSLTCAENRMLINQIFGVNLDGISSLQHSKLSIFSKGQWITHSDADLFYIHTSNDDIALDVGKTDINRTNSGSDELPESLKQKLINFGFTCDNETGVASFSNPTGESVPDALKGQIIKAIVTTIQAEYN
ncbi:hypothetical protein [Bacillus sp. NEB1478]|uniref:hypothetical protein n=1 Tax=Bacillus sp. NEB1478 TaxID=3073816 RepID=UPI0028739DAC|nr:hypothetical protein [Bacillus sp. NEB1478]WNB91325.1 hypothetical protein RGB74_15675 [Bacillus sp. NEB1478]